MCGNGEAITRQEAMSRTNRRPAGTHCPPNTRWRSPMKIARASCPAPSKSLRPHVDLLGSSPSRFFALVVGASSLNPQPKGSDDDQRSERRHSAFQGRRHRARHCPHDDFKQGLALALREQWPAMYKDFRHYCQTYHPKPGSLWSWKGPGSPVIINLFAQEPPDGHESRTSTTPCRH